MSDQMETDNPPTPTTTEQNPMELILQEIKALNDRLSIVENNQKAFLPDQARKIGDLSTETQKEEEQIKEIQDVVNKEHDEMTNVKNIVTEDHATMKNVQSHLNTVEEMENAQKQEQQKVESNLELFMVDEQNLKQREATAETGITELHNMVKTLEQKFNVEMENISAALKIFSGNQKLLRDLINDLNKKMDRFNTIDNQNNQPQIGNSDTLNIELKNLTLTESSPQQDTDPPRQGALATPSLPQTFDHFSQLDPIRSTISQIGKQKTHPSSMHILY